MRHFLETLTEKQSQDLKIQIQSCMQPEELLESAVHKALQIKPTFISLKEWITKK